MSMSLAGGWCRSLAAVPGMGLDGVLQPGESPVLPVRAQGRAAISAAPQPKPSCPAQSSGACFPPPCVSADRKELSLLALPTLYLLLLSTNETWVAFLSLNWCCIHFFHPL